MPSFEDDDEHWANLDRYSARLAAKLNKEMNATALPLLPLLDGSSPECDISWLDDFNFGSESALSIGTSLDRNDYVFNTLALDFPVSPQVWIQPTLPILDPMTMPMSISTKAIPTMNPQMINSFGSPTKSISPSRRLPKNPTPFDRIPCPLDNCTSSFGRKHDLKRHLMAVRMNTHVVKCPFKPCDHISVDAVALSKHVLENHSS